MRSTQHRHASLLDSRINGPSLPPAVQTAQLLRIHSQSVMTWVEMWLQVRTKPHTALCSCPLMWLCFVSLEGNHGKSWRSIVLSEENRTGEIFPLVLHVSILIIKAYPADKQTYNLWSHDPTRRAWLQMVSRAGLPKDRKKKKKGFLCDKWLTWALCSSLLMWVIHWAHWSQSSERAWPLMSECHICSARQVTLQQIRSA